MTAKQRFVLGWLVALLAVLPLRAEPVDVNRAAAVAHSFFQAECSGSFRTTTIHLVQRSWSPATKSAATAPSFYVFNRDGGGFVIISGDDACKPVLAYSDSGCLDSDGPLPEGLCDWLAGFDAQVGAIRAEGVNAQVAAAAAAEWLAVAVPTKSGGNYKPEVLHKTANWEQGAPYNSKCHIINGKNCLVGCVPLAMGIVMNYFRYPDKGTGTLPSYSYDAWGYKDAVSGYELGYPYEWDKFHDVDFSKGYTADQADAVATLLRDIGVAGQAWYRPGDTDDNFWRLIPAVIKHFGYDPNVNHVKRGFFTDDEWMDMIMSDLQDHPLLYAANQESGGHAFVVDGYDNKNNLHINWGWGPKYNGYFALSAFIPKGTTSNFKFEHTTVLGLVPDKGQGGKSEEYFYFFPSMSGDTYYPGLMCSGTPERGKTFTMNVVWLRNGGVLPISGKGFFALTDKDGNIVERISKEQTINEVKPGDYYQVWNVSCKIESYPLAGDRLQFFYRCDNWQEGVWKTPLVNSEVETVSMIEVAGDDTKMVDVTSLKYDDTAGEFELKTMDRVDWSLKKGTSTVMEGSSKDFAIKISVKELKGDTYTLTLKRGKETESLNLKLGNK